MKMENEIKKTIGMSEDSELSIIAVIVIYGVNPVECIAYKSMICAVHNTYRSDLNLKILLLDNSSTGIECGVFPENVIYEHSEQNRGLAGAYNKALRIALGQGYTWMITLDQDSDLPNTFLSDLVEAIVEFGVDPSISAFVPHIVGDGRRLSPYWFRWGTFAKYYSSYYSGIAERVTFALNSASTMRVSALRQVGGYNPWFWLDNSDAFMFNALGRYGKKVFVLHQVEVEHELSMLNRTARMSAFRYHNVLIAESALWDLTMPFTAGLERTYRCLGRWILHTLHRDPAEFRIEAKNALWRRLFHTRKQRLMDWKNELVLRWPDIREERPEFSQPRAPRISVCMASYNGERYIATQLGSILSQIGPMDEVIIVDGASTDRTCNIIREFKDSRICLVLRNNNRGLVSLFEQAVCGCSGDIVFFSGLDDLWSSNRVAKALEAFSTHPEVDLICAGMRHDADNGLPVCDKTYSDARPFITALLSNIYSNKFQGSAMAFRSRLIPKIVPFPSNYYVSHDVWIRLRNTLTGGKTFYIDELQLCYRPHLADASHRLSRYSQIKKHAYLVWVLLIRAIIDFFGRSSNVSAEL